jgi:hypothetical protein
MIGRVVRTVRHLHPLQIVARPPSALLERWVRDVPSGMAPRVLDAWPAIPAALVRLAAAESARGAGRLSRLPARSRLRAFEACYGLELGAGAAVPHADWTSPVAVEPYPASVRARRIAVAIRCGRRDLEAELARAARAVLVRPELRLLGNHLLENGFALACAGAAARGPEADVWWNAGNLILSWQLDSQFLPDGGHVERSASYHVALTAALLESIELAAASGRPVSAGWRDAAARALGWMAVVRTPDGSYPLFNDAALDAAPAIDDVLSLGSALGISTATVTHAHESGDVRVVQLASTGWVRLDAGGACVVIDAGPDADGWQPGHAHADGLTFELWVEGERAAVDFGVASYEAGPARVETRATRVHNTVAVDGVDSCEVWSAFRVGRRGRGSVVDLQAMRDLARVDLEHDGYSWLPGKPRHVRAMSLSPSALHVRDRVAAADRAWASRVRVDAGTRVVVAGAGAVLRAEDRWHPRHGVPSPALVFEQRPGSEQGGKTQGVDWRVEW